jgi:hypothetical protein
LQAEQVPPQSEAQQTLSTQKPLAHCPALVQVVPLPRFSLQALLSHRKPGWQSPSPAQVEAHESSRQELGAQLFELPGTQAPRPSQVLAAYSVAPSHRPTAHCVPTRYWRQAPCPLQVPSRAQVAAGSSGQSFPGSLPAATDEQVPREA